MIMKTKLRFFLLIKKSNSMWQAKDVILHVPNLGGCARNQTLHPRGKSRPHNFVDFLKIAMDVYKINLGRSTK